MAETTVAPNNRVIAFRGKPQRERPRESAFMPVESKAQNAAMHAAAEGNSTLGIPKKVGQEFIADQAPGSVKKLPARVHKMRKRGLISAKAHKRHLSNYGGTDQQPLDASSR